MGAPFFFSLSCIDPRPRRLRHGGRRDLLESGAIFILAESVDMKKPALALLSLMIALPLFARVRVVAGDYQCTNYEYPFLGGGTKRDTYDFSYDGNDVTRPYDSPVRVQVGVSVGF